MLKIVLIVLGVLMLFALLGIGACVVVAYKLKHRAEQYAAAARARQQATMPTPEAGGQPGASQAPAAAPTEIPVYPGATTKESGGILGLTAQVYETSDAVDKVIAFYKDKLGSASHFMEANDKATFQIFSSGGMTTVTISRDAASDKTQIAVAHIGK